MSKTRKPFKTKEYLIQNFHVHCLGQLVLMVSFLLVYEKGFAKQTSSINRILWGGVVCVCVSMVPR